MIDKKIRPKEEYEPLGVGFLHGKYLLIGLVSVGRTKKVFLFSEQSDGSFKRSLNEIKILTLKNRPEKIVYCSNFVIAFERGAHVLSYLRTTVHKKEMVFATLHKDGSWKGVAEAPVGDHPLHLVPHISYKGEYIAYTKNKDIKIGISKNLQDWRMSALLGDPSRLQFIPKHARMFGVVAVPQGILVLYDYLDVAVKGYILKTGALLCSALQPYKVVWVSQQPIWAQSVKTKDELIPLGCFAKAGEIYLYWHTKKGHVFSVALPPVFSPSDALSLAKLEKYEKNPVIVPNPKLHWESQGTFNPAALLIDGVVHLLYRAQGDDGFSYMGYACSRDGYKFEGRRARPAYIPRDIFEGGKGIKNHVKGNRSSSGGGWGGCEDPRLTMIGETIYMTYIAYDGWRPQRIALTSISKEDFLKKRWSEWSWPILISPPGVVDKNACLLPEKIGGKYVFFHRVFPDILIDYVDDLDFEDGKFLKGEFKIPPRPSMWDSRKLGVGATPIKTRLGWLVIYQAVDDRQDSQYKMGAMILDTNNPTKVLYRTPLPILVPNAHYENHGFKAGVAYPCGAVVKDSTLFVYYGGADSYVCVATANLDQFLESIVSDKQISLEIQRVNLE